MLAEKGHYHLYRTQRLILKHEGFLRIEKICK